jgi:CheY-like chemotaxis protein
VTNRSRTVLVADDEDLLLRLVSRLLGAAGFQVLTATCASEALDLLEARREPVDALLLDVVLPGDPDGSLMARLLRERGRAGVVLTSGHTPDQRVRRFLADHDGRFLSKPFAPEELVRAVEDVLP